VTRWRCAVPPPVRFALRVACIQNPVWGSSSVAEVPKGRHDHGGGPEMLMNVTVMVCFAAML
jgi:hypothetical protein